MVPNEADIHPDLVGNEITTIVAKNHAATDSSVRNEKYVIPENLTLGCVFNVPGLRCSESEIYINQESIVEDEAPLFDLPFGIKFPFATLMFISLSIGSYFKFILYRFIYTSKKDSLHRPINVLTLTSAIIHHVTHISSGIWYALVCIMNTPLGNYVGDDVCWIMMLIGVYGIFIFLLGTLA